MRFTNQGEEKNDRNRGINSYMDSAECTPIWIQLNVHKLVSWCMLIIAQLKFTCASRIDCLLSRK